ncbi:E3 ubiquitin-protein ligase pellino homolog 2 [Geodia barretti]|uniref:E3 ubiquitin-protein ligase pellino homolog 2 n=1 Tax=Geodia barretti TaxID=519541 RepID=A0AA35WY12_GEOBA|nr:E3 ubiquitin-protein ligase pellino homolog 2 [Geodia barretti]
MMAAPSHMTRRPTTDVLSSADMDIIKFKPDGGAVGGGGKGSPEYNMPHVSVELTDYGRRRPSGERRGSPEANAPIYGELVVLGTNGSLPCQAISHKMRHSFVLKKQPKATGVSPIVRDQRDLDSLARKSTHTVTLQKTGHVTEYGHDSTTDLFQSMAPSWQNRSGEYDGVTTNGVAYMRPVGVFESGVSPGEWREVTVNGHVRKMRKERSSRCTGVEAPEETNILTDGCLIDLCGVTLMWRTAIGIEQGPSNTILRSHRQELNEKAPQCPVNLLTLHFRGSSHARTPANTSSTEVLEEREPWVYLKCGHLHGYHEWKAGPKESDSKRTCPVCREVGPYVRLELGQQRAFFIDSGALTHAFVPCGHVTTKRTAESVLDVSANPTPIQRADVSVSILYRAS